MAAPAFAPDAENLENPLQVAVLRVMDELVMCEVSPGRFSMVRRYEALIRELAEQAINDPQARKQFLGIYCGAISAYKKEKAEQADRKALARQRALREDQWQAEREADEKRQTE